MTVLSMLFVILQSAFDPVLNRLHDSVEEPPSMKGAAKLISRVPLWPVVGTAFGVVVPFHVLAPPLNGVAVKTQFGPAHPVLAALVVMPSVTSDGAVME